MHEIFLEKKGRTKKKAIEEAKKIVASIRTIKKWKFKSISTKWSEKQILDEKGNVTDVVKDKEYWSILFDVEWW